MKARLEILHCPTHGLYAVSIGDRRVTPGKCCGQWIVVAGWPLSLCDESEQVDVEKPFGRRERGAQ